MSEEKSQIQRIRDGEMGPGKAKKSQPTGQDPVIGPKETVDLTTLPSTADTGHGGKDEGER